MNQSARRVNQLARKLSIRRYLEIGVQNGTTFRDIEVAERTGVDPNFLFDTGELTNQHTRFVPKRSDDFFRDEPLSSIYDVVFIDGLHVFEQVVRDFSNAILRTARHSVIILDDTVPNDVFSSLNSYDEAIRFRKASGRTNGEWHGDVFKAVFYIHDFWPSLNFRTILGSGNPQTLVWRSVETQRRPIFNSFEQISRMTYFDMQDHITGLYTCTEAEAIDLCIGEILAGLDAG